MDLWGLLVSLFQCTWYDPILWETLCENTWAFSPRMILEVTLWLPQDWTFISTHSHTYVPVYPKIFIQRSINSHSQTNFDIQKILIAKTMCYIQLHRLKIHMCVSSVDCINVYVRLRTENHIVTLINTVQVSR